MPRPSRVRRVAKWCGAAWCLFFLVMWPVSEGRGFGYFGDLGGFGFYNGAIALLVDDDVGRIGFAWQTRLPGRWFGGFDYRTYTNSVRITVPIWFALLISAALTYLLFRLDRKRIPAGHCQSCGYDLTGNVSGVCSECGTETASKIT